MKLKVNFLDKQLLKDYLSVLSLISIICSFFFIAIDLPDGLKVKVIIILSIILFLAIIYLVMWLCANLSKSVSLKINNSTIDVKIGDIFTEKEFKVIAFNEYFDSQVDNKIIAENTLNGIFLKNKIKDIKKFDNLINTNLHLESKVIGNNKGRINGKKKKYRLGTIFQYDDYLLTALSKFDDENRAYLYMHDFISFLLNFWNEIDIVYAGRSVSIPLLGSGITRFKEYTTITEQEILDLIIWSFKVSKIKFTYPSKVSIIIHESMKDKINFYKIKE
ncbi:MAG TPA: DUF6430 domain-containing protein [Spirochaetota bacterium]|nr:DUF6430 domain-containing protein [Spirochaetota bacterium]HQG43281.1 DUF6430 domain-containing protein [Spirochaetota bacterium]